MNWCIRALEASLSEWTTNTEKLTDAIEGVVKTIPQRVSTDEGKISGK